MTATNSHTFQPVSGVLHKMKITCKDETNGKLILALEFLSFLNTFTAKTVISCKESNFTDYRMLSDLFENISFAKETRENFHLIFTNDLNIQDDRQLFFPILDKSNGLSKLPQNYIPVDTHNTIGGFHIANQLSAEDMLQRIFYKQDYKGRKILISAGPTAEDIDPVRYITNRSSGKMGIALARAAFIRGAEVELVLGPGSVKAPAILNTAQVRSAAEMTKAVLEKFSNKDAYIAAAAIADYTPAKLNKQKLKKRQGPMQLNLKRTTDVLKTLAKVRKNQTMVGFSVETTQVIENSLKKLEQKNLDMIVVNNPAEQGSGFLVDTNRVSVLLKNGQMYNLPLQSKQQLSYKLLDFIAELMVQNA